MEKPETGKRRRRAWALLIGVLACILLGLGTAQRPNRTLEDLRAPRRYWEDVTIGASLFYHRNADPAIPTVAINSAAANDLRHASRRYMIRTAVAEGMQPWQFWRTVRMKPFLIRDLIVPRDFDDPGRPELLGIGYRLLGGVAPYFGLWLGALLAVPVLLWLSYELFEADHPVAGTVLPLLLASWAHLVDLLALPYSTAGFYLLALVVLTASTVYAVLGTSSTRVGLAFRLLLAGSFFAFCVLCRGSAMTLLPGFLLVVWLAARRVFGPGGWLRTLAIGLAATFVFLLPHGLLRQPRHHAVWGDIWQGLGDFDTRKGHIWSDPALRQMLREEGMRLHQNIGVEFESDQSERISRRIVLTHIQEDPLWFATILVKRAAVTLTQKKLWAHAGPRGRTYYKTTRVNEGTIDRYYNMAATADVFGLGIWRRESPMLLLVLPAALLGVMGLGALFVPRWRGSRAGGWLRVLGCLALAAATLPIAIMTGALEMQGFVLVYLVGIALFAEGVARRLFGQSSARAVQAVAE